MMSRLITWIVISIIFVAAPCSAAPDDQGPVYDLIKLFSRSFRHIRNSEQAKELNPLDHLQIGGVNQDFLFRPYNGSFLANSSKCEADIAYTLENLKKPWALKLFDSYGKPESGVLQGNLKWVGDYNECLDVRAVNPDSTAVGDFRGQYCLLSWSLKSLNVSLSLVSGVCIPDSCSAEELNEDAMQLLQIAGVYPISNVSLTANNPNPLTCKPKERHLNTGAKATIAVLSLFVALVFIGSSITAVKYIRGVLDGFKSTKVTEDGPENKEAAIGENADDKSLLQNNDTTANTGWLEKVLACFCVFRNGSKLLSTDSPEGEQLLCIHGIRFLSMSWVILGHSYIFGTAEFNNLLGVLPLIDNLPFQVLLQAFYSVDSFFVLSGFLLAYLSMKELSKRKGDLPWTYFYVHRFLRLTPMYMVLLAFSATVYFYLGSGPYWPDNDYDESCRKNWWRNLLYINNFDIESGQCMSWSWYLANDMQFFVISPLFLITLWRWPVVGYCLLAIFLCANFACNFFITYHYDLIAGIVSLLQGNTLDYNSAMKKFTDYFLKLYVKPYTRIGPYLVGLLTGYILFRRKAAQKQKHGLLFLTTGWIVATAVTLACVYGLYHRSPTLLASSFFNAFSRTCFAMGLCWVIYVCLIGQGGVVDRILSWRLFLPLSRLTYASYLIHPMIITGYFASLRSSIAFSHPTMVCLFLGFLLTTYALAIPVALILESPLVSLEKLVRKKFTDKRKEESVN